MVNAGRKTPVSRHDFNSDGRRRGSPWALGLSWLAVIAAAGCAPPQDRTGSSGPTVTNAIKHQEEPGKRHHRMHWESYGIGGGGALYSPIINPHDGREIYMSSDMTDVFHSLDFGRSWELRPFYVIEGYHAAAVRFTSDPHVMYALNLPEKPLARGLLKSRDGGRTWNVPVNTPGEAPNANYVFADPESTKRLFFADKQRLFYSCDGGQRFSEVHVTPWADGLSVAGAHFAGRHIYVATSDGVLVSHDNGKSFAFALDQGIPADESIVSFASARRGKLTRFFAVTFKNRDEDGQRTITSDTNPGEWELASGVYRLTLGEDVWQPTASLLSPTEKVTIVATSAGDPDVAYLAGTRRYDDEGIGKPIVLKTADGGSSWNHVFLTDGNANIATGWSGSNGDTGWDWGEAIFGLAVAPSDSDRVVVTDMGYVHVTDDGGQHWRQAYVDPRDENPEGQDSPKRRTYRTSGVEQTSCWWLTWGDAKTIFASFTDFISVYSRDGGRSWQRDADNGLADNTTYHVVTHPTNGFWYAATSTVHDIYQSPFMRDSRLDSSIGTVVASADHGAHWKVIYDFQHGVIWLALDPNRPSVLYASVVSSEVGGIYRLDLDHLEQGATMLPAPPRTKGHAYNVHVLHDGSIVATYSGHQDGNTRVFSDRSGVFLLKPGATAWEDRSAPEMHYWTKDIVIDPKDENRWYVGVAGHNEQLDFGGLYRTKDRGLTWQRISARWRVESCSIDPQNPNRMYMATMGEGLWLTENLEEEQPEFRQLREYPFQHPMRLFWNPYDKKEVWTVSFGGGMRAARE